MAVGTIRNDDCCLNIFKIIQLYLIKQGALLSRNRAALMQIAATGHLTPMIQYDLTEVFRLAKITSDVPD